MFLSLEKSTKIAQDFLHLLSSVLHSLCPTISPIAESEIIILLNW